MGTFTQLLDQQSWQQRKNNIYACDEDDVLIALTNAKSGKRLSLKNFQALISPAAEPYL